MDIKKLNQAIEQLKDTLGDGLIATDIFTIQDGISIAGYNPQPKASAMFNVLTNNIIKTLRVADFPSLDKYFLMNLEGDKMVIILPLGEYRWGILIDTNKAQLGLLVSIAIPDSIKAFQEALA